ncbi:MAG: hypothetical protein ACE37M_14820 [Henriciella sp.]
MQSFMTVFLAAIGAFFAIVMMPPEPEASPEQFVEDEPTLTLAEASPTPVFVLEAVEPLVLALDDPYALDDWSVFEIDPLTLQAD